MIRVIRRPLRPRWTEGPITDESSDVPTTFHRIERESRDPRRPRSIARLFTELTDQRQGDSRSSTNGGCDGDSRLGTEALVQKSFHLPVQRAHGAGGGKKRLQVLANLGLRSA